MNHGKRPPLDEEKSLWEASLAREGTTTGPGAAAGNSIVDAGLAGAGDNSFLSMLMVVYPGNPRLVDSMDITGFNNATGEVTLAGAYKGVAAAIPAGVPYKIVTFRFVPAEVAALQADVGDASTSTLGSLYAILGNPTQTFLAMLGYEGATALANKLTAARAALIDEITAGRMSELDAANIPADIDTLLTRLNALRAGYLDNLSAGAVALEATLTAIKGAGWTDENLTTIDSLIDTLLTRVTAAVALASVCTEARLAELDAANIPTDLDTLLTRLTAQRALNLDLLDLTTFTQETHAAVNANGTNWVDLLDKSALAKSTKICGFKVTVSAGWAGKARLRITEGAGTTKIFPFQAHYEQDTDFTSGTQAVFNFEVVVPVADGYKVQFCSSAAGDVGAGFDVTLDNLDVIEVG